jgi:hypothetical protein
MKHGESEDPQEEFVVEISNLDDMYAETPASRTKQRAKTYQLFHTPRLTARQRLLQLSATAAIILVVLVTLVGTYAPARSVIVGTFYHPTPTLPPGADLFYVETNPPWGHIYMDGKLLPRLPVVGEGTPIQLDRSQHKVSWVADPFETQTCTVTVPPVIDDNSCHFNRTAATPSGAVAWVISFTPSLANLRPDRRTALIDTIQQQINQGVEPQILHPGEMYAVDSSDQRFATAREPMQATLHFNLMTQPGAGRCTIYGFVGFYNQEGGSCSFMQQDCHLLCNISQFSSLPGEAAWQAMGVVRASWEYATLDGKRVLRDQPDSTARARGYGHFVPLQITWDGKQWHVGAILSGIHLLSRLYNLELLIDDLACASMRDEIRMNDQYRSAVLENSIAIWTYYSDQGAGIDCVAQITPNNQHTDQPKGTQPAYLLHRFGIVVAVNDAARKLWPGIPVADVYEKDVALQLLQRHKQVVPFIS